MTLTKMESSNMIPGCLFVHEDCQHGGECSFIHGESISGQEQYRDTPINRTTSPTPVTNLQEDSIVATPPDSRATALCKFALQPEGCRTLSCPYRHPIEKYRDGQDGSAQRSALHIEENQDLSRDFVWSLLGAVVHFNELGHVVNVSFPTDYSLACVTGLARNTTTEDVLDILRSSDCNLNVDCVRISTHAGSSETKALVKMKDPLFAQKLSTKVKEQGSPLDAVPIAIGSRRTECRKINISWHKASRRVWLIFYNDDIAKGVAKNFNEGKYNCLGQRVESARPSIGVGPTGIDCPMWIVGLSNIPNNATREDVERALVLPRDKPERIEMGHFSYTEPDTVVSADVRTHLEKFGPLQDYTISPVNNGKLAKARATFQCEEDARAACSLNNTTLKILGNGKVTVTLAHSIKMKAPRAIFQALRCRISEAVKVHQDLELHIYEDNLQHYTTLKIAGENETKVVRMCEIVEQILSGTVLMGSKIPLWSPAFVGSRTTHEKLKDIAKELGVVLVRDTSQQQIRCHGPCDRIQQAICGITRMLKEESSSGYKFKLNPSELSWAIQGGFQVIEEALDKDTAVLDIVSKMITINGTYEQYATALAIIMKSRSKIDDLSGLEDTCPICFCEPEIPIETSCKHKYCLGCFEGYCRSAVSTSDIEFPIKCHGDKGTCLKQLTLHELKEHLSSSAMDSMLKSLFEEHVQRHPEKFSYCPNSDCGYVYRSSTTPESKHTCLNCSIVVCTYCRAVHGKYTCAEYKEIGPDSYTAFENLKKTLDIRECPKCSTLLEKSGGCDHMICGAVKSTSAGSAWQIPRRSALSMTICR